ncbi:MAG TPA: hypothetical protein EYG71_08215 [Leucothrix sp.]|nr:hypothetical protein [Leucothrix sp.]
MVTRNERLWHGATSLVSNHNKESGVLAKPRQLVKGARLQAIISVVALLVKGTTISCEVRLGYDGL